MEPITISRSNLSIKIKASVTPSISESSTALFAIAVSYTHPNVHNGRIHVVSDDGPRETISFRYDRHLDWSQLHTVSTRISALTNVSDPIFFEEYFMGSIFNYCQRTTSMYREHRVVFLVSVVVSVESTGRAWQAVSYVDDVLILDFDVQGRGTRQDGPNRAIEKLERLKDATLVRPLSDQCAICLEEFGRGNDLDLGKTQCSHVFHYRCVKKWLGRRQTCPMCRCDLSG